MMEWKWRMGGRGLFSWIFNREHNHHVGSTPQPLTLFAFSGSNHNVHPGRPWEDVLLLLLL